ncbi:dolichyl-diphosphooligosaccharide protein glycosyltransferase subunit [Acrasis kona]|uniref:Dolichyl-diphosphooligosaccharide--protein glycosyltransferase subunit OST2 n=1 Tax=Acrasis kona TaxID=1008807 RepID=A0AAW2YJI6_9EUKA
MANENIFEIIAKLVENYKKDTPQKVKLIDLFIVFTGLTAAIQFVYRVLVGTFPLNAFLAAFFTCLSLLVFTVALRKQVNPATSGEFRVVPERAFGDYIFCCVLTFFVAMSYIG